MCWMKQDSGFPCLLKKAFFFLSTRGLFTKLRQDPRPWLNVQTRTSNKFGEGNLISLHFTENFISPFIVFQVELGQLLLNLSASGTNSRDLFFFHPVLLIQLGISNAHNRISHFPHLPSPWLFSSNSNRNTGKTTCSNQIFSCLWFCCFLRLTFLKGYRKRCKGASFHCFGCYTKNHMHTHM